jgi:hypothetical protein
MIFLKAVRNKNLNSLILLVAKNASLNIQNLNGESALIIGNLDIILNLF